MAISFPSAYSTADTGGVPTKSVTNAPAKAKAKKPVLPPGYEKLAAKLQAQLWNDIGKAKNWADPMFGRNDPDMARLIEEREKMAYGTDTRGMDLARARGMTGINSTLATNLRQLKGMQGASGLRGGAAIGQALPALTGATQARAGLERDLQLGEMDRRAAAMKDLETTMTGERAGALGTTFGLAGLGSQNRYGALQYLLGDKYLQGALAQQAALGGSGGVPVGRPPGDWLSGTFESAWDDLQRKKNGQQTA